MSEDDDVPAFEKLNFVPVSRRSPEERNKDVDDILDWIRSKKEPSKDPTGEFKKVNQLLPRKWFAKPEDRARDIEGVLDWLRNKDVDLVAGDRVPSYNNLKNFPTSLRSTEERSEDLDGLYTLAERSRLMLMMSHHSMAREISNPFRATIDLGIRIHQ